MLLSNYDVDIMPFSKYIFRGIAATIAYLAILVAFALFVKNPSEILSYDPEILLPFTYGISGIEEDLQKETLHPLMIGVSAFVLQNQYKITKDSSKLDLAKKYLDFLAFEYPYIENSGNLVLWKYPFAWRELQPGWYSGLANSSIALAFLTGYQVFGDIKYKDLAFKAMNGVINTVKEGGCTVEIGENSHWLEEYSWKKLTKDNAYFVNNGFLVALLTLKLFADQTNDPIYKNAFNKSLNAFKQTANSFYFDSGEWTYYMLNPKEIETLNYAIYDLVIFKALYKLTSQNIFKSHISKREEILKKAYPIFECSNSEGVKEFIFSNIGPPHPYLLDKTQLRISFLDKNKLPFSVYYGKNRKDESVSLIDRIFLTGEIGRDAVRYEISSQTSTGNFFRWYKSKLNSEVLENCESEPFYMPYDLTAAYDGVTKGIKEIIVDPSVVTRPDSINDYTNNIAVAIMKTKEPIDLKYYKYFGLLAKPTISTKQIGINIYDSRGQVAVRYYLPLKESVDNLILLNRLGIPEITKLNDSIVRMDIVVYTSEYDKNEKFSIKFSDIILFKSEKELYSFFKNNVFHFPRQY